jgi:tetratricopeptide (TPR) repeat protein
MTALGELKSLDGDSGGAQAIAGDVLTFDAKFEPAMVLIARDYLRHDKTSLASLVLESLLDGDKARAPNNAEAYVLRGILLLRSGARQAAIEAFRHAAELRPDLVDAQAQLGYLRLESNDADGAIDPLEKAIAYGRNNTETHLALAEAYRIAGGRATVAKKEYDSVLAAVGAPAQLKAVANYDLGLLYFFTPNFEGLNDAARYDKAANYFQQYKSLKGTSAGPGWPDDADAMYNDAVNAKAVVAPTTGAAGAPSAKLPSQPLPAPSATATKPATPASALPPPAASASAKPATSANALPPPAASASAKPATSASALPPPSASPSTKPSGAPK